MARILRITSGTLAGLLACLLVMEAFLRLSGAAIPSFVLDDPRFGRVLRPGTPLLFVNEGFHLGSVNAHGYLGPDYAPDAKDGALRIALLGDSFVEGFQVFDRHHFRSLLERALNGEPGQAVEVMNFGFSGFNFPRMVDYARTWVAGYDPDLVLFFVGIDDLLQPATDLGPRFRAEGDSVTVDLSFRESAAFRRKLAFRAARNLSFYTLLKKSWQMVREGKTGLILLEKLHPAYGAPPPETDWVGESERADPAREAVNLRLIEELGRTNRMGKPRVAFVVKRPIGPRYTELVRSNGIPILDPTPALDELRRSGTDPNWWPVTSQRGHWNQPGHAAIAAFLAPRVRALTADPGR